VHRDVDQTAEDLPIIIVTLINREAPSLPLRQVTTGVTLRPRCYSVQNLLHMVSILPIQEPYAHLLFERVKMGHQQGCL